MKPPTLSDTWKAILSTPSKNFLDPTHTRYIHAKLLRNNGKQSMQISQSHHERGFVTQYRLNQQQNGLINKLFDKGITVNNAGIYIPGAGSYRLLHNRTVMNIGFPPSLSLKARAA